MQSPCQLLGSPCWSRGHCVWPWPRMGDGGPGALGGSDVADGLQQALDEPQLQVERGTGGRSPGAWGVPQEQRCVSLSPRSSRAPAALALASVGAAEPRQPPESSARLLRRWGGTSWEPPLAQTLVHTEPPSVPSGPSEAAVALPFSRALNPVNIGQMGTFLSQRLLLTAPMPKGKS